MLRLKRLKRTQNKTKLTNLSKNTVKYSKLTHLLLLIKINDFLVIFKALIIFIYQIWIKLTIKVPIMPNNQPQLEMTKHKYNKEASIFVKCVA